MEERGLVQGGVFWIDVREPVGSSPEFPRPCVVVQNNLFNRSRINTVVTCSLTTNLRRARDPGNVLLDPGEANLPRQSVVNVSQVLTVDKLDLRDYIGTLSTQRMGEILRGTNLLLEPRG